MFIGWRNVYDLDVSPLREVAGQWRSLADALDATVEDLGAATRDLPAHWWAGDDAKAADDRITAMRIHLAGLHDAAVDTSRAVARFADEAEDGRRQLHAVVAEAVGQSLVVDLVAERVYPANPDAPAGHGIPHDVDGVIESYRERIELILKALMDLDDRETDNAYFTIDAFKAPPTTVMPTLGPRISLRRVIDRNSPAALNDWWTGLDPLVQDELVRQQPELVGPALGLPSRDRDAANRILVDRDRTALDSRKEDLAQEGRPATDPLVRGVDARLAALDEIKDDPRYLINYVRGDTPTSTFGPGDTWWDHRSLIPSFEGA